MTELGQEAAFPMRHWRTAALAILLLALFAGVMALDPIAQSAEYHDFADQRALLGVPNFVDVASNIAFLVVGALGIALCAGPRRPPAAAWMKLFICTVLTGVGSAYYHWAPNDATLAWDRLPLALTSMALLVALVADHVGERLERLLLAPALAAGVMSVLWWQWSGDLRPYVWVQFAPLACIPFVLATFPARYTHRRFMLFGLGLYGLAKAAEFQDAGVFALTGHLVSGHTLKHLLAAGAIFTLLVMLRRRHAASAVPDPAVKRTRTLPIIVGNMFEWFDFTIYGFFATTIAHQFFPPGDEQAAILAVTATFGVAFVMRPIGAVVFGLIGDRWGRKTSLVLTFVLMALGTAMIGFAPTYATAGVLASVILVAGRLLQGFSASGEAGSSLTLLIESTPHGRRGAATGWLNVGVYAALVFGSLAALAVNTLLSPADAQAWGWRVPFLLGLLIAPIGLYMRYGMKESQEFLDSRVHVPTASIAATGSETRQTLRGIATVIGLAGFVSPVVYLILIFMPGYAVRELKLERTIPMLSTLVSSAVLVLLLVPMGMLCDRVGAKRLIVLGGAAGTALVVPLMWHLTQAPSLASILLLQCSLCVCLAMYLPGCGPIVADLFPVSRRALGFGLGYNLGIIVFGAFAPFITAWLIQASGDKMMVAWYVLGGGLISVMVAMTLREPARAPPNPGQLSFEGAP